MITNNIINKYNIIKWSNKLLYKISVIWEVILSSKGACINESLQLGLCWSKADIVWLLVWLFSLCKCNWPKFICSVKLNWLSLLLLVLLVLKPQLFTNEFTELASKVLPGNVSSCILTGLT